jgi:hypothetical protein
VNGHVSVTSPPTLHSHSQLQQEANGDESSVQSNSNSDDFSDEGVDPSRFDQCDQRPVLKNVE